MIGDGLSSLSIDALTLCSSHLLRSFVTGLTVHTMTDVPVCCEYQKSVILRLEFRCTVRSDGAY